MNDDIDKDLIDLNSGDFLGELFLSTDGKNTVHVKANTKEGRKAALEWAKLVYEGIKSNYGTKQELNKETYNPQVKADPNTPICAIHNVPMTWKTGTSRTTGKPYAFWSCSQRMPDGSFCKYKPTQNAV